MEQNTKISEDVSKRLDCIDWEAVSAKCGISREAVEKNPAIASQLAYGQYTDLIPGVSGDLSGSFSLRAYPQQEGEPWKVKMYTMERPKTVDDNLYLYGEKITSEKVKKGLLAGSQKVNVQDKEPTVRDSFSVIRRDDHMPVFVVAKGRDDIIKAIREKFGEDSQIIRPERLKAFLKSIEEPARDGTYIESPRPDMRTLFVQDGNIRGPLSYSGPNAAPMDDRIAAFNGMMDILGYAREVKAELQRISGYRGEGAVHYATAYYPVIYHNALEIYQGDYLDGRITWDEYNCKIRIEEDGDLRDGEYLAADRCRERVFFFRSHMGPDEIKAAIGRFCLDDGVGVGDKRKSNIDVAINDIALSTDEKINATIGYSTGGAKSNGPKI